MTRNITKALLALGFVGAMAVGTAAPSKAQGFYFEGPGFDVGVGRPWYRHHRYYDRYYGPRYHYWRHHRYYRGDWD